MLISPLDRALPFRVHERLRRPLRARVGSRDLLVPSGPGMRHLSRWQPTWKSEVIADQLGQRDGVFLDIGANVGQTLADHVASGQRGGYLGVEPIPACAAYVQQVIELNQLRDAEVLPIGLAERSNVLPLYVPPGDTSSATTVAGLRPDRHDVATWISVHRFDDLAEPVLRGRSLALIKIDVEGAELGTLQGMQETLSAHRPPVMCEVLYADARADMDEYAQRVTRLHDLLSGLGYDVRRIEKTADRWAGLGDPVRFPLARWAPETSEDCDYLFTPR